MNTFYFYQVACRYENHWFDEYGTIEVTPDYVVLDSSQSIHLEVYKTLKEFKELAGKDYVKLLKLE